MKRILLRKGKELALPIIITFRDIVIDDILSLNNSKPDVCVDHIEPAIVATKDTDRTTSYLDHTYNLAMRVA